MNHEIILKHSCIKITNYTMGDCEQLEGYFTLFNPVNHCQYFKGLIYDEDKRELILPRGLDVYLLERLFNTEAQIDYTFDDYDLVDPIMIKYMPRDDNQKTTLRFVLGEGEYKANKRKSQICVNNNTGTGKTYVGSMLLAYTLIKTIVISSTTGILDQWVDRMTEYTDLEKRDICIIKGSGTINRLLHSNNINKYTITHNNCAISCIYELEKNKIIIK